MDSGARLACTGTIPIVFEKPAQAFRRFNQSRILQQRVHPRRSYDSSHSSSSRETFSLQNSEDAAFRTSEETDCSFVSPTTDFAGITTLGRGKKSASLNPSAIVQPLRAVEAGIPTQSPLTSRADLPESRPSHATRSTTRKKSPAPTFSAENPSASDGYSYYPFTEYKAPRSSFVSTHSCGRADSIDLDPDFVKRPAQALREGLFLNQQGPQPSGSSDHIASLILPRSSPYSKDLTIIDSLDEEEDNVIYSTVQPAPKVFSEKPATSCSFVSVASAASVSIGKIGHVAESKDCRLGASIKSGRAFVSHTVRKLSPRVMDSATNASNDSKHSSNSLRLRSRNFMKKATSFESALAHSSMQRPLESDNSLGQASDVGLVPSASYVAPPSQFRTSVSGNRSMMLQARVAARKTEQEAGIGDAPSAVTKGTKTVVPEWMHTNLPSYHRGLRKQVYPPRVRYERRNGLSHTLPRYSSPSAAPPAQFRPLVQHLSDDDQWRGPGSGLRAERPLLLG
ncbi:uncharacterized protein MEPE_00469 [Melanopsichium pennsylvanicum]|uniref:Uncharacterized protein n=2 Tax=Melanopsichium pennsylvanicum TaxID=63383 RepID=A0AAJ5C2T9_9BASI|nr:uncharacterized protein BN887_04348 [Melanopsichium pennsylvanicum 4]SNX81764.1 uncharacterized protein MEPE_00469 [Melanopsichium pennsylvanicum]